MKPRHLASKQHNAALERYDERFDNAHYARVTGGKSTSFCNRLIDDCLALCGSPYHSLSESEYTPDAISYLERFADNLDRRADLKTVYNYMLSLQHGYSPSERMTVHARDTIWRILKGL
jgi:hypothetical protein